jgi:hypothetical protein
VGRNKRLETFHPLTHKKQICSNRNEAGEEEKREHKKEDAEEEGEDTA